MSITAGVSSESSADELLLKFAVSPLAADVSVKQIRGVISVARVNELADDARLGTGE